MEYFKSVKKNRDKGREKGSLKDGQGRTRKQNPPILASPTAEGLFCLHILCKVYEQ